MVEIILAPFEMLQAAHAGIMRQVENCKKGRRPAYGVGNKNDWQIHIEGCLGEYALSKYLGVHWPGKGRLRAPDVGDVDVRTSSYNPNKADLILHDSDSDDRVFWLVAGINGRYSVRGWIRARDGKRPEFWGDKARTGRPAYFVPQSALNRPGGST